MFAMLVLFSGCSGSNVKATNDGASPVRAVSPDRALGDGSIKGRGFDDIQIALALRAPIKKIDGFPDSAYSKLLKEQLVKAFKRAGISSGARPGLAIYAAIEEIRYSEGRVDPENQSIFRIRLEVKDEAEALLMRIYLEASHAPVPTTETGEIIIVPAGFTGKDWQTIRKIIPALAINITKIAQGLREGRLLGEIALDRGADNTLRKNEFGLSELTNEDIREANITD